MAKPVWRRAEAVQIEIMNETGQCLVTSPSFVLLLTIDVSVYGDNLLRGRIPFLFDTPPVSQAYNSMEYYWI